MNGKILNNIFKVFQESEGGGFKWWDAPSFFGQFLPQSLNLAFKNKFCCTQTGISYSNSKKKKKEWRWSPIFDSEEMLLSLRNYLRKLDFPFWCIFDAFIHLTDVSNGTRFFCCGENSWIRGNVISPWFFCHCARLEERQRSQVKVTDEN